MNAGKLAAITSDKVTSSYVSSRYDPHFWGGHACRQFIGHLVDLCPTCLTSVYHVIHQQISQLNIELTTPPYLLRTKQRQSIDDYENLWQLQFAKWNPPPQRVEPPVEPQLRKRAM